MNSNSDLQTSGNSSPMSVFERITNSIVVKIIVIFFLMLILLIPLNMVDSLIQERKVRESNVTREIAMKWGKDQVIAGPVIAVPYDLVRESIEQTSDGKNSVVKTVVTEYAFLLPEQLDIQSKVMPEALKRGIYQAVVYNSSIQIKGKFNPFNLEKLRVKSEQLKWAEAKLVFGIEDAKGLLKSPTLEWDGKDIEFTKTNQELQLFTQNLYADLPLEGNASLAKGFDIKLELRGSKSLNFFPLAKQSTIRAEGDWANPSFNGSYLPEDREVGETFKASWNIPSFSRRVAQQWDGKSNILYRFLGLNLNEERGEMLGYDDTEAAAYAEANAAAGIEPKTNNAIQLSNDYDMVQINFLPSVNNYQKTTRVTKYGALVILLSFVSLVFMEIIRKQRVHIIQYVLIGAAMVLFYALLLAITEHLGFNIAYLIAGILTVLLISLFIRAITKNNNSAMLFGSILTLFYSFIFILMQLRDYSLIVGTIGVFIILAVLMRLSTKINWYKFDSNDQVK